MRGRLRLRRRMGGAGDPAETRARDQLRVPQEGALGKAKRRARARAVKAERPQARPVCPWCGGWVCIFEWKSENILTYECGEHGIMEDVDDLRTIKTSLGNALVIKRLQQVDERPDILAAGLPVFLEAELAGLQDAAPADRTRLWKENERQMGHERAERAKNPARTIWWPWTGPEGTERADAPEVAA